MSFPIFRFTLDNDIEGQLEITEPGGWDQAMLKMERNEKYHSLVEFYEQPLTFYGANGTKNGGLDYIRNVEETQGVDADIRILIEVNFGGGYEELFNGLLDLSELKEIDSYKADIPVVKDSFWTKFITRTNIPVDVQSPVSLDGETVLVPDLQTILLTSQKLNREYFGFADESSSYFEGALWTVNNFIQYDLNNVTLNELPNKYILPRAINTQIPAPILIVEFSGDYTFDLRIEASGRVNSPLNIVHGNTYVKWYIQVNADPAVSFTETNVGLAGYQSTVYTYSGVLPLNRYDSVYIYGDIVADIAPLGTNAFYQIWSTATTSTPGGYGSDTNTKPTYWQIIGATEFDGTESDSIILYDVADSVVRRCTNNGIYSDFLGGSMATTGSYITDGCAHPFYLLNGLHLRQYSFTEKPMYISFDDLWNGADPIFCLGLGYETSQLSPDEEIIRIENRDYFYDSSSNSVLLSYVDDIERSYTDNIYKKIEIGYQKWESEDISGIDDPQTKHTYATEFRKTGEEITLYSKFIAASYAIESTRRKSVEKTKDYKLDNNVFIISINTSASPIQPEIDENFTSITNLNNPDTRYNLRITPYWNFTNWARWFASSFTPLTIADWKFSGGEGNTSATYETNGGCLLEYGSNPHNEDDDITIADTSIDGTTYNIKQIEFEHPLSWTDYKSIRDNRNLSIGVSDTNTGHESYFIMSLEYKITEGKAKFRLVKAG